MVFEFKSKSALDHTERYRAAGLSVEFLDQMSIVLSALKAAGYKPYDQLYGYVLHGNDKYITRLGGAREIVAKMDIRDVKIFLKHYKGYQENLERS